MVVVLIVCKLEEESNQGVRKLVTGFSFSKAQLCLQGLILLLELLALVLLLRP